MLGLTSLLVFVSVAMAGYAFATVIAGRADVREGIRRRLEEATGPGKGASLLKDQRWSKIGLLDALLGRLSVTASLARLIRQAGLANRVGEVVLYIPLLASAGLLAGTLLGSLALGFLLAAAGATTPIAVLRRRRTKRLRLFSEQLPDALDLMRAALQAGHSLPTAMHVVAEEYPDPIAEEFRTVAEEVRLGLPMRDALHNLRDRVDDQNVPILIVGVLVAQEVGGNLTEVLDNVAYTVRERFKLLRDVQVMTAQGRLSGMVLTALPILVGLFMYFLNPGYFAPMIETRTGWYMMGYSVLSILAGHFVIQRIVRIRV
jgi:tight adherence protein B